MSRGAQSSKEPTRRLLLSIHDVGPRSEGAVDRLRDHLGQHTSLDRVALLVVPNHGGEAPIQPGSPFATRLREWSDRGAEVFVHGWFHRDSTRHRTPTARFKAQYMTAGEGEFLGLDRACARALMRDGKKLIEDVTGRAVAGFIAPAWLYGPGALDALADCGFMMAEDHWKVWSPATGQILAESPVLTWASRSRARIASSLLAARLLPTLLQAMHVARVGVHPGDTTVPAIMSSIDHAVARLSRSHRISRYAELPASEAFACAS
ncbi:polysaccharide deacetylase family protein [Novosphingobium sp. G106]|nr:polysaccharide deacetylase family protein [Novosphingobium sp. G106]